MLYWAFKGCATFHKPELRSSPALKPSSFLLQEKELHSGIAQKTRFYRPKLDPQKY